jgi:hypothetical protein
MVALDPTQAFELVSIAGSTLGATAAALLPFWQIIRQKQASGDTSAFKFDKMFLGTVIMAFVTGMAFAFMSYNASSAVMAPGETMITAFMVSAISAYGANKAINTTLQINPQIAVLSEQVKSLQDELNLAKLKVASLVFPIAKELQHKTEGSAPITNIIKTDGHSGSNDAPTTTSTMTTDEEQEEESEHTPAAIAGGNDNTVTRTV